LLVLNDTCVARLRDGVVDVGGPFDQVFFGSKCRGHRRHKGLANLVIAFAMCLMLAEMDAAK
jgi:hypothetical protein